MDNLTDRQIIILRHIVEEYIESAEPVGSETLEKKYQLSVSPATIRNEMATLTKQGYLHQPHTSAGRAPTPRALKYYVKNLLKTEDMAVSDEVSVKEKVWDSRHEQRLLMMQATKVLAEKSSTLALISTDTGELYYAGSANILDYPEFYDIDLTRAVLGYLDRASFWQRVCQRAVANDPYYLLFEDDFDENENFPFGFLYTRFNNGLTSGAVGVIGPYRLPYRRLIPMVTYFGTLLSSMGR